MLFKTPSSKPQTPGKSQAPNIQESVRLLELGDWNWCLVLGALIGIIASMHWLGRHRLSILGAICFFFTGLVLLLNFTPNIPFYSTVWRSEQGFEDLLRREG